MTQCSDDSESGRILEKARRHLVGGVTAAARSSAVFATPFFARRASGSRLWDADGREYIDLHTSFGAALLGHGHARIAAAVQEALSIGMLCAFETALNADVAERIYRIIPCAEKTRFTLSGTETTAAVVKLARGYTGRDLVVKFEGHFHGFNESLQYNYWPPRGAGLPAIYPESQGAPAGADRHVIVLPFNDPAALEATLSARRHEIAAVILEPVNFNSGGILPQPDFLRTLRTLTSAYGIVLIFDEILSGFRTGPGGMQAHLGVIPDLCTLGKALGGGMPLSAFAGRAEIMDTLSPSGPVSHSGTYLAHPTAIYACRAFLEEIAPQAFWDDLIGRTTRLCAGLRAILGRRGLKCMLMQTGARFCFLFGMDREPVNYRDVAQGRDTELTKRFCAAAMRRGVFTWIGYHHGISAAHTDADVELILERIDDAAKAVA